MQKRIYNALDEPALLALAEKFAKALDGELVIFLEGNLGAGKTTFCRGLLHALGHQGAVKSPTYTLVEPYQTQNLKVFHFDLYRLNDAEELEYMGIRDYFSQGALCLIEWPSRGEHFLPKADLQIEIRRVTTTKAVAENATENSVETRDVILSAQTNRGELLLDHLA